MRTSGRRGKEPHAIRSGRRNGLVDAGYRRTAAVRMDDDCGIVAGSPHQHTWRAAQTALQVPSQCQRRGRRPLKRDGDEHRLPIARWPDLGASGDQQTSPGEEPARPGWLAHLLTAQGARSGAPAEARRGQHAQGDGENGGMRGAAWVSHGGAGGQGGREGASKRQPKTSMVTARMGRPGREFAGRVRYRSPRYGSSVGLKPGDRVPSCSPLARPRPQLPKPTLLPASARGGATVTETIPA